MKSQLTRTLPRAYSIVDREPIVEPFLIGFFLDGQTWQAVDYAADGSILGTIAELDTLGYDVYEPPSGENACLIRDQLSGTWLAWRDDDLIRTWSLTENLFFEYELPVDRVASPPVFDGTLLYWFEMPATVGLTWELCEARPDFSSKQVRGMAEPDPFGFGFVFEWQPKLIAHTGSSVIGAAFWRTLDFEEGVSTVRMELNGSSETASEHDALGREDQHDRAVLLPHLGRAYGAVIGTDGEGGGSSLASLEDDVEAVTAAHWPRSGDWWITNTRNGDVLDGRALIYGEANGKRKVIVASIDGPHDEPELMIEPSGQPDLLFMKG